MTARSARGFAGEAYLAREAWPAPRTCERRSVRLYGAGCDRAVLVVGHQAGERVRPRSGLVPELGPAPAPIGTHVGLSHGAVARRRLHDQPDWIRGRQTNRAE